MPELKDKELESSVKEIPALIKTIKEWFGKEKFSEIKAGDKTFSYSGETFAVGVDIQDCPDGEYTTDTHKFTVKAGKVIDYALKETPAPVPVTPDFSAQLKAQADAFEQKFAAQKTDFDNQVKDLTEKFNQKISELISGKLQDMFTLIEKIAASPTEKSEFKKKDGEPVIVKKNVFEEAKELSQKVFPN